MRFAFLVFCVVSLSSHAVFSNSRLELFSLSLYPFPALALLLPPNPSYIASAFIDDLPPSLLYCYSLPSYASRFLRRVLVNFIGLPLFLLSSAGYSILIMAVSCISANFCDLLGLFALESCFYCGSGLLDMPAIRIFSPVSF